MQSSATPKALPIFAAVVGFLFQLPSIAKPQSASLPPVFTQIVRVSLAAANSNAAHFGAQSPSSSVHESAGHSDSACSPSLIAISVTAIVHFVNP